MIECDNGAHYTGYTRNLTRRFRQHLDGTANVRYTRSHKPVRLAMCWQLFDTVGTALKVESLIKRGGVATKRRLLERPDALLSIVADRLDRDVHIVPFDAQTVETAARALSPDDIKTASDPFVPAAPR